MYVIKHTQDLINNLDFIEIEDAQKTAYAKICLNLGASLQELTINNLHIIKNLHPLTYDITYASSILFPFANRIEDGRYTFEKKHYQFEINQTDENNAIHGLVYNKTFELIDQKTTKDEAMVKLKYDEQNYAKGFPYTYTVILKYILTKDSIDLNITVKNTDTKTFPFTIGWHPYFNSSDLFKSSLSFKSNETIFFNKRNITLGIKHIDIDDEFMIKDKTLDDCFVLDPNEILFETPNYSFVLSSSEKDSFLQLYTPAHPNTIAIEPTTGVSDSFNNGIGLKILKPNDAYNIYWNIKLY